MVHRPSATPEDLYANVHRLELVRDDEAAELPGRLAELAHQAALIGAHVTRLRVRPLFTRDDISERQADELETRLRSVRQSMAALQATRETA